MCFTFTNRPILREPIVALTAERSFSIITGGVSNGIARVDRSSTLVDVWGTEWDMIDID